MSRPFQRIICLDFDGVIHGYQSGWKGVGVIPDPPVPGALKFIEDIQNAGFRVAIHSSRSKSFSGRRAMKRWLEPHVIEHFGVDRVGADDMLCAIAWPWFKPAAFLTIDDRAVTFTGEFPAVKEVAAFRSWVHKGQVDAVS